MVKTFGPQWPHIDDPYEKAAQYYVEWHESFNNKDYPAWEELDETHQYKWVRTAHDAEKSRRT